jgi:hypothetical protein
MLLFAHISYFFCLSAKLIFHSLFPSKDFTYLHGYVWLYSSITNKAWTGYVYNSVYLCSREPCIPKINTISFTALAFYEPQNTWKLDTEPIHCSDPDTFVGCVGSFIICTFCNWCDSGDHICSWDLLLQVPDLPIPLSSSVLKLISSFLFLRVHWANCTSWSWMVLVLLGQHSSM